MEPIDAQAIPAGVSSGALFDRQRVSGATFYEDYGRLWAASFGDPGREYRAAREDAVAWDVSPLAKWHFTGPDALTALDRLTTRPTSNDGAGQVRYLLMLNDDGLLVDEGTRYIVAPDDAWFVGNEDRPAVTAHIHDVVAGFDVTVANRTDEIAALAIQGPRSCEVLAPLVGTELEDLRYYRAISTTDVVGGAAMISRTGFSGELGYEVFALGGPDHAVRLWDAVVGAGATPMGLDAVEMLRIEAGLVIADEDYVTGESDPVELSLDAFIELDGPEFVGRDAVAARIVSRNRILVTISFDGLGDADPIPGAGRPVIHDGLEVGRTTSVQRTPRFGTIALAILDSAWTTDGVSVVVDGVPATVRPRPIDGGDRARSARPARTARPAGRRVP